MSTTLALAGISFGRSPTVRHAGARRRPMMVVVAVAGAAAPATGAASLYEVLRVKETATAGEIKTAYRALAKRFHPDVAGSSGGRPDFLEIHRAYATLSDPAARVRYDRSVGWPRLGFAGNAPLHSRRWETDQCW